MAHPKLAVVENEAPAPDEALYDALLAALSDTARGRAFLEEYARRVRAEDTTAALAALARIETMLLKQQAPAAADEVSSPAEAPGSALGAVRAQAPRKPGAPEDDHAGFAYAHPGYKMESEAREDLLAQVMALSPEERIALFS